jgi:hypothetical protein
MRSRVVGMRQSDILILEHLYNDGRELIDRPSDVCENIGYEPGTIRERMPVLRRAGLLQYHDADAGQYTIDDLGRRYLAGELTGDEIDDLEAELQQ